MTRLSATCERMPALATFGLADGLALAAAPSFAIMAMLSGIFADGPGDVLCSGSRSMFPLAGMVPMYLLMAIFHSTPWLKLIPGLQRRSHRS